jgi:hypothetical protein
MDDSMEPARAVERLDELAVALEITDFASLLYARLRPRPDGGATLSWSSAGHPAPLLVHPVHGPRSLLEGAGMVLGVTSRGPARTQGRTTVEPGSTLLLYTDGLVEQRRRDLDETTSRLEAVASGLLDTPLATFCDEILARSESDTSDDIALLAVRLPDVLPVAPRCSRDGAGRHSTGLPRSSGAGPSDLGLEDAGRQVRVDHRSAGLLAQAGVRLGRGLGAGLFELDDGVTGLAGVRDHPVRLSADAAYDRKYVERT